MKLTMKKTLLLLLVLLFAAPLALTAAPSSRAYKNVENKFVTLANKYAELGTVVLEYTQKMQQRGKTDDQSVIDGFTELGETIQEMGGMIEELAAEGAADSDWNEVAAAIDEVIKVADSTVKEVRAALR
jgi:phage tail tape-measure protein